ncbi:MAG: nuclear transport factor 2 family protein [Parvibaculaceae bacterium]
MEARIRKLFERYESVFNRSLGGDLDLDEVASLYAAEFIAASPAGVMTGKNDDQLKQVMTQGYARYRAMGTKQMRIRNVRLTPMDDHHCVAHVAWTAIYARKDQPDATIDFDVHYFVQELDGEPKVFGWVSGDEQALLREHGII